MKYQPEDEDPYEGEEPYDWAAGEGCKTYEDWAREVGEADDGTPIDCSRGDWLRRARAEGVL